MGIEAPGQNEAGFNIEEGPKVFAKMGYTEKELGNLRGELGGINDEDKALLEKNQILYPITKIGKHTLKNWWIS